MTPVSPRLVSPRYPMSELRAFTLKQPNASLVTVGAQTIITSARPTAYRGPLLIHAGKQGPTEADFLFGPDWKPSAYRQWWDEHVKPRVGRLGDLPLGAVLASCQLIDCVPIVDDPMGRNCLDVRTGHPEAGAAVRVDGPLPTDDDGKPIPQRWTEREVITVVTDQRPFGDFTPGRWAWLLGDVKPTTERCPRCWGSGDLAGDRAVLGRSTDWKCPTCGGAGLCAPVPMRGRQGLWTPKPEDWCA